MANDGADCKGKEHAHDHEKRLCPSLGSARRRVGDGLQDRRHIEESTALGNETSMRGYIFSRNEECLQISVKPCQSNHHRGPLRQAERRACRI